jgi:heme-degrading monooxygenase HmoA
MRLLFLMSGEWAYLFSATLGVLDALTPSKWLNLASDEVKGFRAFHLLRGPEREDHVLYSSHTIWASQEDFTAWTKSEQFRAAHQHAGERKPLTLGHPEFEGFEVIQTIETTRLPA